MTSTRQEGMGLLDGFLNGGTKFLATGSLLAGCMAVEPNRTGIYLDNPAIGAREVFVGFNYGRPKDRESWRTYTRSHLILELTNIREDTLQFMQIRCYDDIWGCDTSSFTLDRRSGKLDDPGGESVMVTANLFPRGVYTEDFSNLIAFKDYTPVVSGPTVGFARNYGLGKRIHDTVTVMVNPSGIPMDVGGVVLVLSRQKRILDVYRYEVFGTDGGWELKE